MKIILSKSTRQLQLLVCLALLPLALSGCGMPGAGGGSDAQKAVLVISPGDPCGQFREEFAKSKAYFTDEIIKNVGTGAVLGAIGGGAVGLLVGNPVRGAAIGAGIGAAGGGIKSYADIQAQNHKDSAELAQSINADLTKESEQIDHTKASFARVRKCRFEQAVTIKTQVKSRQMDRATAQGQLTLQKGWFGEEIALAKEYRLSMEKRGAEFEKAAAEIKQQETDDAAKAAAIKAQARAAREAAGTSIPNKRKGFDQDIVLAEANSEAVFNLDSNKKIVSRRVRVYG